MSEAIHDAIYVTVDEEPPCRVIDGPALQEPSDGTMGGNGSFDAVAAEALQRLVVEFPDVPDVYIEGLMAGALAHTADAPVGKFRVVLAERGTRARLLAEASG
jgi:hypothetical protein